MSPEPPRPAPAPEGGAASAEGDLIAGRFRVTGALARGVLGPRHRALDGERQVALEFLDARAHGDPRVEALFHRSARAARRVRAEAVPAIQAVARAEDGRLCFASDLVLGESLGSLLARTGPLSEPLALTVAVAVARALATGHAAGVAHGALGADVVVLDPRSDSPVRLLDYGLGRVAAVIRGEEPPPASSDAATEPELRADVQALGNLLVEMRGGGAARISRRVRALAERAVGADPARRFADASELATALEHALRAPRLRWPAYALAAGALAVVGLAGWRALQHESAAAESALGAVLPVLDGGATSAGARAESASPPAEPAQRAAPEPAESPESPASIGAELAGAPERAAADAVGAVEALRGELARALGAERTAREDERAALERRVALAEQRSADLEQALSTLRASATPAATLARGAARILAGLERGDADGAAAARAACQALHGAEALVGADAAGRAYLDALTEAGLARASARASADAPERERSLAAAAAALERCASSRGEFAEVAPLWRDAGESAESARLRAERLLQTEQELAVSVREIETAAVAARDAARAELAGAGWDARPARLIELARVAGDVSAAELAERFARHAEETCVRPNGLALEALRGHAALDEWAVLARVDPDISAAPGGALISALASARRFYLAPGGGDPGDGAQVDLAALARPSPPAEPAADWRTALRLQAELALPASAYPIRPGATLVWRRTGPGGETSYEVHTALEREPDGAPDGTVGARWRIRRELCDALGQRVPGGEISIRRDGSVLSLGDRRVVLLDFARAEDLLVASFEPSEVGPLPEGLGIRGEDLQRYRDELARADRSALVLRDARGERWISPAFGLVRERAPGHVKELVYATPTRG